MLRSQYTAWAQSGGPGMSALTPLLGAKLTRAPKGLFAFISPRAIWSVGAKDHALDALTGIDPVPVAPPALGVRAEVRAKKPATPGAAHSRWRGLYCILQVQTV